MFQGFFAKVGFGAMNCWKNGASLKGVLALLGGSPGAHNISVVLTLELNERLLVAKSCTAVEVHEIPPENAWP